MIFSLTQMICVTQPPSVKLEFDQLLSALDVADSCTILILRLENH